MLPTTQTTPTSSGLSVLLPELHNPDNGRIDASKVAEFLAVTLPQVAAALAANYAAVHKTPDAASLQPGLGPIKRSLTLISQVTRNRHQVLVWLNSPHPDLDEQTPLAVILSGRADAVVTLLENAIAGLPG